VGGGTAIITATLGPAAATGQATVEVTAPPSSAAPRPTVPAADVISIFSNAYQNITVDTWSAEWDQAQVTDYRLGDDDIKIYTDLQYAGIEFTSNQIDATDMTHFHMDIWAPEGRVFKIKLVDFGDDGAYGGGDDSEHELVFTETTTPALETGKWVGFELPMEMFSRLTGRAHVAQLIIAGDTRTVYVDNIYFHK
jgi:hypothetical protein